MSAIPEGLPVPDLSYAILKPYWEAAKNKEFRLPRCQACKTIN